MPCSPRIRLLRLSRHLRLHLRPRRLPRLLRPPACSCVVGLLLVPQTDVCGVLVLELWLVVGIYRASALDVEGARVAGYLALLVVVIAETFPAFVVFDALFFAAVRDDGFVGKVGAPEDERGHYW